MNKSPKDLPFGTVRIHRPDTSLRLKLDINALDARTRELARSTYIEHNGTLISCQAYEVRDSGELILRLTPGTWEFVDPPQAAKTKE